ncbi:MULTISPECIES: PepSY domain-containing protein [Pseudomonas]|uniref:Peptidase n=1 Tax=Pseudomonas putida TaxID=303 RepID=A0A177S9Y9_PSEPU|nr:MULTISPECIES: PepSY domain-containing protein [Pseudomonas]MDG9882475.1 PepSY domain-containing protein [Pseudomonas sp. GD04058]OAI84775.1 peptidase [Pseudomonas putida]
MKPLTSMFAGLALVGALAAPAFADQPGADWKVTQDQAQTTLKAAGYTQITKIEADDGYWEGEGVKADGMKYEFKVDPHSGKIVKDEMDH